jgi:hypothetical protein
MRHFVSGKRLALHSKLVVGSGKRQVTLVIAFSFSTV